MALHMAQASEKHRMINKSSKSSKNISLLLSGMVYVLTNYLLFAEIYNPHSERKQKIEENLHFWEDECIRVFLRERERNKKVLRWSLIIMRGLTPRQGTGLDSYLYCLWQFVNNLLILQQRLSDQGWFYCLFSFLYLKQHPFTAYYLFIMWSIFKLRTYM